MGDKTGIEWADATWSPLVGCTHVSPGCDNCYAAREASGRLKNHPVYAGLAKDGKFTGEVRLLPERLDQPYRWKRPRRIFVNSMSDLFHDAVPDGYIMQVFRVMAENPHHVFQVLTKRPGRMASFLKRWGDRASVAVEGNERGLPPMPRGPQAIREVYNSGRARLFADMLDSMGDPPPGAAYPLYDWQGGMRWWPPTLPNIWWGTSVENQHWADVRLPHLVKVGAAGWTTFVSAEPLLGPVDLSGPLDLAAYVGDDGRAALYKSAIDWVIVGGESGPKARPMHPSWARSLRDQCVEAGVAYLFKQWGEWAPYPEHLPSIDQQSRGGWCWLGANGAVQGPGRLEPEYDPEEFVWQRMGRVGKKRAGRELDGREWNQYPGDSLTQAYVGPVGTEPSGNPPGPPFIHIGTADLVLNEERLPE